MVSRLTGFWLAAKGLWKLESEDGRTSEDCCRRWELDVTAGAARREEEDEEVGRVCRVQLRRAEPADAGTGRIVDVCVDRGEVVDEVLASSKGEKSTGCRDVSMLSQWESWTTMRSKVQPNFLPSQSSFSRNLIGRKLIVDTSPFWDLVQTTLTKDSTGVLDIPRYLMVCLS